MSTSIPDYWLNQWSASGDSQILIESEDCIKEDFESGLACDIECWRGGCTNQYTCAYQIDDVLDYGRSSSWTTAKYAAEMFADIAVDNYGGERVIYHLSSASMLDIANDSDMSAENEFISHPESRFRVVAVDYNDYDGYLVELEEIW